MNIGLDYDDTFTRDPAGWHEALTILKNNGHTIYGVTMRRPAEASGMSALYDNLCKEIFFTGRRAKKHFVENRGVYIDVWIDDNPVWVLTNSV